MKPTHDTITFDNGSTLELTDSHTTDADKYLGIHQELIDDTKDCPKGAVDDRERLEDYVKTLEAQNKLLRDQIDQLEARLKEKVGGWKDENN